MRLLGDVITQDGFDDSKIIERLAARAIVVNENKEILMIHSSYYDDVTFPGGGVDPNETLIDALHRECLEEVGGVLSSYKDFYKITEQRVQGKLPANVYTSYYYICTCSEYKETSLLDYEIELGYSSVWISVDDAIDLNNKTLKKLIDNNSYTGVVVRELRILNELKNVL